MQRRSAIAVAGAVTGILIAGTVAGVAVINAASSGTANAAVPIVAASVDASEAARVVVPGTLPDVPVVPESTAAATLTRPAVRTISARQARQAATAATPGKVLGTTRLERGGYDAFAVQIERGDGSVVTGYVEASSGVVFDWAVDKEAPAPVATYDDEYEEEGYEEEEYEEEEYEGDEHEGDEHEDDRDGDDD